MFDVKLTRPTSQVIIAGPYKTAEEAQMQATRLTLQHNEEREKKIAEFEANAFDPEDFEAGEDREQAKIDYAVEKRMLDKFLRDTKTEFTVVKYRRGGI